MIKCNECNKELSWWKSYGKVFSKKHWCKECYWDINELYDDLGLDEINEIKIKELTKRIKKLEVRNLNQEGTKE